MGAAYFYHLTTASLEETAPMLLEKSLAAGWRVEVRGQERAAMEALDAALWRGPGPRFLPHGMVGGDHDAAQPVLLTAGEPASNDATAVMAVHGAEVSADEVTAAQRVMILFDGHDADAVAQARTQWKTLTDAGCSAQYWSQETGTWSKQAER